MESTANQPEGNIVCPLCFTEFQAYGRCPKCGKFSTGDWPEIPSDYGLSLWLPPNLSSHATSTMVAVAGELCTPFPYSFGEHKKVTIRIGGSRNADVQIRGAESIQSVLLQNNSTADWWAYDCGTDGGTFVNKKRIHFQKLQDGDVITIAGVALVFRGNRLETIRTSNDNAGMSLCVKDLCFTIPEEERKVLDNVTFTVSPGELVGVLGPSGCGKSSLVQRIIGLAKPDSGTIYANGHLLLEVAKDKDKGCLQWGDCFDEFRAATAYLPQNVEKTLHDDLTLDEEIDCFRRIHLPPSEDEELENESCLKTLGLAGKGDSRIRSLSGGEKRRVGIALALLRRPQLLLLDEPCAGLDPASEDELMKHLRGVADQGRTILCVTHVLANLEKFDKLLVLSKGKIVYLGKPAGLLDAFDVENFANLYQMLRDGVHPQYDRPSGDDRTKFEFPSIEKPSLLRRAQGYLRRMMQETLSAFKVFSAPSVLLLWQPLLLVIGIRLACGGCFRDGGDHALLGFCASLAMFWIGINNASRELVKERVPGRCLENLNQVPLVSYLLSKFVWAFALCFAQTLVFTVLLCGFALLPLGLKSGASESLLMNPCWWFAPLYLSCLMGALCGLSVSAVSRKVTSAVSVVPNIAIFALLFSEVLVRFKYESMYIPLAKWLAWIMPCYWSSEVLAYIQQTTFNWGKFGVPVGLLLLLFVVYSALSAVIVWFCQRRNESVWNGR